MNRLALLAVAAAVCLAGCGKGGSKLDGEWSMLLSGSDNGTQHMSFSEGKKWKYTAKYENKTARYVITAYGTYKLSDDNKSITMTTDGGDTTMTGGDAKQKSNFEEDRAVYLKAMEQSKGISETSPIIWLNDNSFETSFQGSKVSFHRR